MMTKKQTKKAEKFKAYPLWQSRSQGLMSIDQMDDSHLANTINYLEQRALDRKVSLAGLDFDLNRQIMETDAAKFYPILKDMRKLARTRGLKIYDVATQAAVAPKAKRKRYMASDTHYVGDAVDSKRLAD